LTELDPILRDACHSSPAPTSQSKEYDSNSDAPYAQQCPLVELGAICCDLFGERHIEECKGARRIQDQHTRNQQYDRRDQKDVTRHETNARIIGFA
jgi:hypothetical protein